MDSLTQIALGAAVSVAVMGRRTAVWKAALWGGVAGTLPDLDVLIDHGDAVLNMVRHRAESHSFFYLTLFSPLLAWLVTRIHGEQRFAAGPPQGESAPLESSNSGRGGAWGTRCAAGPPQGASTPLGLRAAALDVPAHIGTARRDDASGAVSSSDPHSGGAWGPYFRRWWLAMWLVLITHPLLDTMTVYGTQLLMPFTNYPFAIGSVFIIDLAYTVPLIVGVVAALRLKNARGFKWNAVGLVLSTLYLFWGVVAQLHVERIARNSLVEQGINAQALLVTPAPFNTVLWRLVAIAPGQYLEGYYSLLDDQPTVTWAAYPRDPGLIDRFEKNDSVARIAAFSHGFFNLSAPEGRLWLTDLRMGLEPAYTFRFDLGALDAVGQQPPRPLSMSADFGSALPWLWDRIMGRSVGVPMPTGR